MTELAHPLRARIESSPTPKIEVHGLTENGESAWERYVQQHPRATVFHCLGWKRALETLGNRACYLHAISAGKTVGVMPLFECRGLPFHSELISLPHTNFAGPLADGAAAEKALLDEARRLAGDQGARALFIKDRHPGYTELSPLMGFVTFERDIAPQGVDILSTFDKGARYWVRRGFSRNNLRAHVQFDLDEFYLLLSQSYRRLGTPLYPRRFFRVIAEQFEHDAVLLIVRQGERSLAAVFALRFRDTLTSLFSGEAYGARKLGVNPFKYFALMEWAGQQGLARYNFGRSRLSNPGAVAFKRHLGFEASPLPYRVLSLMDGYQPTDPNRGFYRFASQAWSRLPNPLATRLGPHIVRLFPH